MNRLELKQQLLYVAIGVCGLATVAKNAVLAQEATPSLYQNAVSSSANDPQIAIGQIPLIEAPTTASTSDSKSKPVTPPDPDAEKKKKEAEKKKKEDLAKAVKGAYGGVFYANKFDYLKDPAYSDWHPGENLKGLKSKLGTFDFGGEFRARFQNEENFSTPGQGLTGNPQRLNPANEASSFWLSRTRLYSNWRVNDCLRFHGEYIYADFGGHNDHVARQIEVNRNDLLNAFGELKLLESDSGILSTRIGRQELLYGNQRLISPLDWANTRRTFEGAKFFNAGKSWNSDAFWTRPVVVDPNHYDNFDENQDFFGTYFARNDLTDQNLDLYYLGLNNRNFGYSFHTMGFRYAKNAGPILFESEMGYQFGQNSDDTAHNAGAITVGLGHKMKVGSLAPTAWMWYDWASGDDDFNSIQAGSALDQGRGGWHHLFPLSHKYNGFMDLFGRRNLHDINAQLITPVNEKVNFLIWYHYFLLDELTTPYSVVMTPYNRTAAAADRELGHEIDFLWTLSMDPRNQLQLGYSFFSAGDYYDKTPGVLSNADAQFVYFQYQTQF